MLPIKQPFQHLFMAGYKPYWLEQPFRRVRNFSTSWPWISCWATFVALTWTRRMFPRALHGWDLAPNLHLRPTYLANEQNLPLGACPKGALLFCGCWGSLVLENIRDKDLVRSQKNGHRFCLSYETARQGQSFHNFIIPDWGVWMASQHNCPPLHYVESVESLDWL